VWEEQLFSILILPLYRNRVSISKTSIFSYNYFSLGCRQLLRDSRRLSRQKKTKQTTVRFVISFFFVVVVELKWQDIRRTQSTPLLYVRLAQPLDNEMKLYRHTAQTERESFLDRGTINLEKLIDQKKPTEHTHMTNYHNCISRLDI
jgi:hypothetical protein